MDKRKCKASTYLIRTILQVPVAIKRVRSLLRMNNFSAGKARRIDCATDFPNLREFPWGNQPYRKIPMLHVNQDRWIMVERYVQDKLYEVSLLSNPSHFNVFEFISQWSLIYIFFFFFSAFFFLQERIRRKIMINYRLYI